jgi:hypothetical protein
MASRFPSGVASAADSSVGVASRSNFEMKAQTRRGHGGRTTVVMHFFNPEYPRAGNRCPALEGSGGSTFAADAAWTP